MSSILQGISGSCERDMWNNRAGFAVCREVASAVPLAVAALKVLTTSLLPNVGVGVYIGTDRAGWCAQDRSRPFRQIPCDPSPKLPKLCGVENKKPTAVARVPQAQVVLCCYRARCFETCCSLTLMARSCLFTFVILQRAGLAWRSLIARDTEFLHNDKRSIATESQVGSKPA